MAKHPARTHKARANALNKKARAKTATPGAGPALPDANEPSAPTTREMMVMAGNRPHETILHEFTLEDFGLDVPRVIHSDHL